MTTSPLAPGAFPTLPTIGGLRLNAVSAGIRRQGRNDLMMAEMAPGTTVAGVFTRSLCTAAPVDWCRQALLKTRGRGRAVIVNSGNANAFTGAAGQAAAERTARSVAAALGVAPHEVLVASTGVIGEDLPVERIVAAVPALVDGLAPAGCPGWEAAAHAIGTTDTFSKGAAAEVEGTGTGKGAAAEVEGTGTQVEGTGTGTAAQVEGTGTGAQVAGIAKGSGMIAPDMATMLAFVFTDMAAEPDWARECLAAAVARSFNRITVDSDTSTSDMVLLVATGTSGIRADRHAEAFRRALDAVTLDLAHQVVRDGEGASKFVAVTVSGAADDNAATAIARAVADSPLVKTALAASDANWGRIVAAVGKAGQRADRDRLCIWIGDEQCADHGRRKADYNEARATRHLQGSEISLRIDVGVGSGQATVWTCDLTHGYININAGYRT